MRFTAKVLGNSFGILLASTVISAITFSGSIIALIITGCVYSLIHSFVRPVVKLLAGPLILLTLGLFTFVIQIFLLWLTVVIVPSFEISTLAALLWGTLIVGVINLFL